MLNDNYIKNKNRILIAAPKSGSGKTLVTCALLRAFADRGIKVCSMKCGPDYIDPMFHRSVLGIPSGNLDSYFVDSNKLKNILANHIKDNEARLCILEGVMGFYDGIAGTSVEGSTYDISEKTGTDVILTVDAKGMSVSIVPLIKGILEYKKDNRIKAIILNRCSAGYYDRLKELIESECDIKVIGYIPDDKRLIVPERHLGLYDPESVDNINEWLSLIGDTVSRTVDLDYIIAIAEGSEDLQYDYDDSVSHAGEPLRLAVAKDKAFSFYYEENFKALRRLGADLVFFSPMDDEKIPDDVDGIILGGGYPECFAKELSENSSMLKSMHDLLDPEGQNPMPFLAECGGFLYLQKKLTDVSSNQYKMVGIFDGEGVPKGKLTRFGYAEYTAKSAGVFGSQGISIRGHEFHHWDCTDNGVGFAAKKPKSETSYDCMKYGSTYAAGFPHLYYECNIELIKNFLDACAHHKIYRQTKARWDSIAKPIDSLGFLESYVCKINSCLKDATICERPKTALAVFCGDHGVVKEGVTQTDSSVSRIVSENISNGISSVNIMGKAYGVEAYAIDVGLIPCGNIEASSIINRNISAGTNNIRYEAAMTNEECAQAILAGEATALELKDKGFGISAIGEMGIGNTTPTSVLAALLLNVDSIKVTGRGAGLSDSGMEIKHNVVRDTVLRIQKEVDIKSASPMELLRQGGGYEIAAMVGFILKASQIGLIVLLDGVISNVAALVAYRIDPRIRQVILPSHVSKEGAARLILEKLHLSAPIDGQLCLGEGTGAMLLVPMLDQAYAVYRNMSSFEDNNIVPYERLK